MEESKKNNIGQSKKQSLYESCINIFSGMIIGFFISETAYLCQHQIQHYIWGGFIWNLSIGSNLLMSCVFTLASVIRSYTWRRYFNKRIVNSSLYFEE